MPTIELKNITVWHGRKEIAAGTGKAFSTIKRWSIKYGCPLRYDPGRHTYLIEYEYISWLKEYDDNMKRLKAHPDTPQRANKTTWKPGKMGG